MTGITFISYQVRRDLTQNLLVIYMSNSQGNHTKIYLCCSWGYESNIDLKSLFVAKLNATSLHASKLLAQVTRNTSQTKNVNFSTVFCTCGVNSNFKNNFW